MSVPYPIPSNEAKRLEIIKENNQFKKFVGNRYLKEITKLAASYFNVSLCFFPFILSYRTVLVSCRVNNHHRC
jgi:hypothetical protein